MPQIKINLKQEIGGNVLKKYIENVRSSMILYYGYYTYAAKQSISCMYILYYLVHHMGHVRVVSFYILFYILI